LDLAPASESALDVNACYGPCAFDAATFRGIASVPWGLTKSAASLSNFVRSMPGEVRPPLRGVGDGPTVRNAYGLVIEIQYG
jgi:hypothetical protein